MQSRKLAKAAGALMIITILSKVIGFLRDTLIAGAFGATYLTDAYNIAIIVPSVIYGLFGGAITTTFIPLLNESYAKGDKKDAYDFANTVMNILFILSVVMFLLSVMFTPQLVKLVAPKFRGDTYQLAVELTKLSVINVVFITLNSCYTAILQTLDIFIAPAMLGFITSLPIIGYIIAKPNPSIQGLTLVMVIGTFLQVIFQIPWMVKHGFKFSLRTNLRDKRLSRMLILLAPVLIGSGVSQINTLVDRNMASGLPAGSIASLGFASIINNMVSSIFITAVTTVIYPTLARVSVTNKDEFKSLINKSITSINLIVMPASVGMMVLRVPIITVLYKHGVFNDWAVQMTSGALFYFTIGLVFVGIRDVVGKAFYALQDTKTPMINAIIGILFNIGLNLVLVKRMGIRGLALATSTSAIVCAVLLIISLKKRIGNLNGAVMLKKGAKILLSSLVMGGAAVYVNTFLSRFLKGTIGGAVALLGAIAAGVLIYAAILALLKVEEFNEVLKALKGRLKRDAA